MGLPAFSWWIVIFFAELSQVGCRTRGVDGRLVHPALGRIRERQFLLTEQIDAVYLLLNSARGRPNFASLRVVAAPGLLAAANSSPVLLARWCSTTAKETWADSHPKRRRRASKGPSDAAWTGRDREAALKK